MFKNHGTKILGAIAGMAGLVGAKGPAAMLAIAGVFTILRGFQNSGTLPGGPTGK